MIYDVAAAIDKGRREYQEDAFAVGFPDEGMGFVVLADGMGGHEAGDIASRIAVAMVTHTLQEKLEEGDIPEDCIPEVLKEALQTANASIATYVSKNRSVEGMGTTLVAPILNGDRLHWLSVGDSPLYVFDDGVLFQVNEDHSLAPQIDMMCQSGMLDEEAARYHPDRNCLTSVLMGDTIPRIDCGKPPVTLQPGNIVIVSSDGLQFLSNEQIAGILNANCTKSADAIANALMQAVEDLDDPDQDNISLAVIKVLPRD